VAKRKPAVVYDVPLPFELDGTRYLLLRFDPGPMTVAVRPLEGGPEIRLPFARLPRKIKAAVRPRK